jgi:hypothetical protein
MINGISKILDYRLIYQMELRCPFAEPQKTNQISQCYKRNRFAEPLSFQREQLYYKYFNTPIRQGSENRSRL